MFKEHRAISSGDRVDPEDYSQIVIIHPSAFDETQRTAVDHGVDAGRQTKTLSVLTAAYERIDQTEMHLGQSLAGAPFVKPYDGSFPYGRMKLAQLIRIRAVALSDKGVGELRDEIVRLGG